MKNIALSLFVLTLGAAPSAALEWHPLGARAVGMGGAGVASAQGPLASYWNPAALGRPTANAYGLQIPVGVHAALTGSVIEGAQDLEALKDDPLSITQAKVDTALSKLNSPGNGLRLGVDGGIDFKVGSLAIFTNTFLDMGAVPTVDASATTTTVVNGTNNSKLTLKGVQVLEFGVGYGRELGFAPGLYVGGNVKLMSARVGYYDYFVLRNNNDDSNMLTRFKDGARGSSNFGVDLGVLWDVSRTFEAAPLHPRIGLVGRNLNNPKFKQPDAAVAAGAIGKFAVNPQLRMGASLSPFNWWNITSDLDLTRNLTPVDNVASRQFGLGNEFNVFNRPWINIPLRVGLMRNLAETGSGTMLTAGAGLNFLHVIVDVSGAVSPKRVTTQSQGKEKKIPREARAAVQLSILFGGSDDRGDLSSEAGKAAAPKADEQPVSTEKVRQEAEKAQKALETESGKASDPSGAPKQP
ncbi:MAG: conjugal transfer protein TraF [Elusimicrobiota bacterium]